MQVVDTAAHCCAMCQSVKNCSFWTYTPCWSNLGCRGTAAKPSCYGKAGSCCWLKDAAGFAGRAQGRPGQVSGSTKQIPLQPTSVSAQLSADGKTAVARIVNHAAATQTARISLVGMPGGPPATASAVSMASSDLSAENTAADVNHVAPVPLSDCKLTNEGTVEVELPGYSFTIVTMKV